MTCGCSCSATSRGWSSPSRSGHWPEPGTRCPSRATASSSRARTRCTRSRRGRRPGDGRAGDHDRRLPVSLQPAAAATVEAAAHPRRSGRTMSARRSRPGQTPSRRPRTRCVKATSPRTSSGARSRTSRVQRAISPTTCRRSGRLTPTRERRRRSRSKRWPTTSRRTRRRSTRPSRTPRAQARARSADRRHGSPFDDGEQLSSTFTELEQLDAGGELEDAFEEADSCDELTSGSSLDRDADRRRGDPDGGAEEEEPTHHEHRLP